MFQNWLNQEISKTRKRETYCRLGGGDMAARTEEISCRFIGEFKVGDNLVRNAEALCHLSTSNKDGVFNKLMVIQSGCIVEAALDQIVYRAQNFNREGVPNISEEDRKKIEATQIDRLNNLLQAMKKYKVLDGMGEGIYAELDDMREYRNKVHIQSDLKIKGASRDEDRAFSDKVVSWSLDLCIRVLKHLNERYARPAELKKFAHTLSIPTS